MQWQWDEEWRSADRQDDGDLPADVRRFWPRTRRGWGLLVYFAGILVVTFVVMATIGTQPVTIAGLPFIYWWAILLYVGFVSGLYVFVFRPLRDRGAFTTDHAGEPATESAGGDEP